MKFQIKDENECCYNVEKIEKIDEEVDETPAATEDACKDSDVVKDADEFTADEKKLIKKLLKHADDLLAMVDEDADDEDFSEEALELGAETTDEEVEDEETVVDSDNLKDGDKKVCDSASSFGSIERSAKKVCDSEIADDDEISKIWSKRYGG